MASPERGKQSCREAGRTRAVPVFPRDLFRPGKRQFLLFALISIGWDSFFEQLDALKGWGKPQHQPLHCNEVGKAHKGPSPLLAINLKAFTSEEGEAPSLR